MSTQGMCRGRRLRLAAIVGLVLLAASVADAAMAQAPLGAGPPFLISSVQDHDTDPAVAYNPGQHLYVVVWDKNGAIMGRVVDERGALLHAEFVANGAFGATNGSSPDVAYNSASNTFLVVWRQYQGGALPHGDIYAMRLPGNGWGVQGQFWVSLTSGAYRPRVAANPHDGEFLVVWYRVDGGIYGQRVAAAAGAERIESEIPVALGSATPGNRFGYETPDVAYNASQNRYLVVYTRYQPDLGPRVYDICGRVVNADGTMPAGQITIDNSLQAQWQPAVAACAMDPAHPFLVVYDDDFDQEHYSGRVYVTGRLLNADGNPVELINITPPPYPSEFNPAVAASDGFGYTVVWALESGGTVRIWGRRVRPDVSLEAAFEISARTGAPAGSEQNYPAIVGGSPSALVVWVDNGWGSGTLDIAGRLLGFRAQLPVIRR